MTIEYLSPTAWRTKCYELSGKPSRKFEIVFVTPVQIVNGDVTVLMVGYWFVEK